MLPRLLCEELCSLNPLTDRLTFSVIWKITPEGKVWQLKSGGKGLMADNRSWSRLQILFVMVFVLISPVRPSRSWASGSAAQSSAPAWSWVMTTLRAWSRPLKRCSLPRSCPPWTQSTPLMRSTRLCWTCTLLPRTSALSASQEERSDWTRWGSTVQNSRLASGLTGSTCLTVIHLSASEMCHKHDPVYSVSAPALFCFSWNCLSRWTERPWCLRVALFTSTETVTSEWRTSDTSLCLDLLLLSVSSDDLCFCPAGWWRSSCCWPTLPQLTTSTKDSLSWPCSGATPHPRPNWSTSCRSSVTSWESTSICRLPELCTSVAQCLKS